MEFVNTTDYIYTFNIKWVDHPYLHKTKGKPWSLALGEIDPGKTWELNEFEYLPGSYIIDCYMTRIQPSHESYKPIVSLDFTIQQNAQKIIVYLAMLDDKPVIITIADYWPIGGSKPN